MFRRILQNVVMAAVAMLGWAGAHPHAQNPAPAISITTVPTYGTSGDMRGVVTGGSGRGLLDVPGAPVIAKTGTAEFERDGRTLTHAWMVAAQGDLAVAVFVDLGSSGSGTAGPLLERFLRER